MSRPSFPDMVLSSRRLPSLLRVPPSMVPRSRKYYEGATTSHLRTGGRLFVRFRRPPAPPVFVFAAALRWGGGPPPGPGTWVPAARSSGYCTWTHVGSLRSPGDPSCAFAPLLDPGRTDVPRHSGHTDAAPVPRKTKASDDGDIGARSRSFGTRSSTLRTSCCHSRARLASGWLAGLYREGVEPSGPR
jgi:hypothetical protein